MVFKSKMHDAPWKLRFEYLAKIISKPVEKSENGHSGKSCQMCFSFRKFSQYLITNW